jgi:hypothetical protein
MKIRTIEKVIQSALGTAVMGILLALPAAGADTRVSEERLQAMADAARTAGEHAEVGKQYRLRAEALDAEAAKHEQHAKDLARSAGAMAYKWPAMANGHQRAKDKAVQTRRAAAESRRIADHHIHMAVEAGAVLAN